jgi:copper chaperone CopZ
MNKLPRLPAQEYYLKVRMCCAKCKEKVEEEIWEVPGVFDVTVEKYFENKVVVTVMPWSVTTTNLDLEDDVLRKELLRKARKIDCRAQFLPPPPPPPTTKPPKPPRPPAPSTPPPPNCWEDPFCYRPRWPCSPCDYPPRPPCDYWPRPSCDSRDPSCTLFYFLFLLFLLVSMIIFRRC